MDDYRDIGAKDFERYEKIRRRFSQIVTDFDLVTNSTPGVLRIDPVIVGYVLNNDAVNVELPAEEEEVFRRQVVNLDFTLGAASSGGTEFFPAVDGEIPLTSGNGRVERVRAIFVEIDRNSLSSGVAELYFEINDGTATSSDAVNVIRLTTRPATEQIDQFLRVSNDDSTGGFVREYRWSEFGADYPLKDVVIGPRQGLVIRTVGAATDDDIDYSIRIYYEYRTE